MRPGHFKGRFWAVSSLNTQLVLLGLPGSALFHLSPLGGPVLTPLLTQQQPM